MRKFFYILVAIGFCLPTYAVYKGLPEIACNGCSSSTTAIADFARDQMSWLGWKNSGEWYVRDITTNEYFYIKMLLVRSDGSTYIANLFDFLLRTFTGTIAPERIKIEVYSDDNGRLLGDETYLLSEIFASNGAPVPSSARLKISATYMVRHYALYGHLRSYIGYSWTYTLPTGSCYGGNCEHDFE